MSRQPMHARVWRRIAAFLTDLLIVAMLCSVLLIAAGSGPKSFEQAVSFKPSAEQVAVSAYFALFVFLYHLFCEYIVGQTAGMLLWRLLVLRSDKDKGTLNSQPLSFGQAFTRNVFLFPLIPSIVQGIIWVAELGHYLFVGKRFSEAISMTDVVEFR